MASYIIKEKFTLSSDELDCIVTLLKEEWGGYRDWLSEILWYLDRGYKALIVYYLKTMKISGFLLYKAFPTAINIGYLVVARTFRGKKIGTMMLNFLINKLHEVKKQEFIFVDTSDAIDFYLKNKFLIVDEFVLTLPDEPLEYLAIYSKQGLRLIESKILRETLHFWIKDIYDEESLNRFKEYFDFIFQSLDILANKWKGKIPLSKNKFLTNLTNIKPCKDIPINKLKSLISTVVQV